MTIIMIMKISVNAIVVRIVLGASLIGMFVYLYIFIYEPVLHSFREKDTKHFLEVFIKRDILDGVSDLNEKLGDLRRASVVSKDKYHPLPWEPVNKTTLHLIRETNTAEYIRAMRNIPGSAGIALKPDRGAPSRILRERYRLVVSEPLCTWMNTPGFLPHRYYEEFHGRCTTDPSDLLLPADAPMHLDYNYLTYLNIIPDSIVNTNGTVVHRDLKFVPEGCHPNLTDLFTFEGENVTFYDEVFVISQYWGNGYFHRLAEVMPRLVIYLQFLKQHQNIGVHATGTDEIIQGIFRVLGLSPGRIVTGQVRAGVVYLPRGAPCGWGRVLETQLLSAIMRNHTEKHLSPSVRNKIILIRRNFTRMLSIHEELNDLLFAEAAARGLELVVWRDDPVLQLEVAMRLFHEAVMIVAPHGAGEVNAIFSQPGTYLIEVLCEAQYINLCYQKLSSTLGLRYHGIPARNGCNFGINTTMADVKPIIETYLDQIHETLPVNNAVD